MQTPTTASGPIPPPLLCDSSPTVTSDTYVSAHAHCPGTAAPAGATLPCPFAPCAPPVQPAQRHGCVADSLSQQRVVSLPLVTLPRSAQVSPHIQPPVSPQDSPQSFLDSPQSAHDSLHSKPPDSPQQPPFDPHSAHQSLSYTVCCSYRGLSCPSSGYHRPPSTATGNVHHLQTRAKSDIVKPKQLLSLPVLNNEVEPTSFTQANKDPKWRLAIADEFNALLENNTWELVPYNDNINLVGCKWIYKIKYKSNGTIERPKARLVARDIHQLTGIDFHETFSPVVKPTTVRLLLSPGVSYNWVIR